MSECVHSIHALLLVRAEFPDRLPTAVNVHRWQMVDNFSDFDVTSSCVVLVYGSALVGFGDGESRGCFPPSYLTLMDRHCPLSCCLAIIYLRMLILMFVYLINNICNTLNRVVQKWIGKYNGLTYQNIVQRPYLGRKDKKIIFNHAIKNQIRVFNS